VELQAQSARALNVCFMDYVEAEDILYSQYENASPFTLNGLSKQGRGRFSTTQSYCCF